MFKKIPVIRVRTYDVKTRRKISVAKQQFRNRVLHQLYIPYTKKLRIRFTVGNIKIKKNNHGNITFGTLRKYTFDVLY